MFFEPHFSPDLQAAATRGEIILDAVHAADHATSGEVRSLNVLHQLLDRDVGIIDLGANAIDDFGQVVRWHVRRHADGDARAAIDEQVGKPRRKHCRFGSGFVVGRNKIDCVLVHVLHQHGAQ